MSSISALPACATITGNEKIPCSYGGETQAMTPNQIKAFVGSSGGSGGSSPSDFTFDQMVAASTWSIVHNLGRFPAVTVVDSTGDTVEGDARYVDGNTVRIDFSAAFAGTAYLT